MTWFNFLHFYQPANIDSRFIEEASEKSYFRLLRLFEENKDLRMTINVSGCLLDRMSEINLGDFSKRLSPLIKSGRIEIVGSAAYHAFLPLLPESEILFQIKEQEKILKKYLGVHELKGFFMPEMAYSREVARVVKSLGYEYLILDPIAFSPKNKVKFDSNKTYIDEASDLKIVFRDRDWSTKYAPDHLKKYLDEGIELNVVTASDAELYGLRHLDQTSELEKIVKDSRISTGNLHDFLELTVSPEKIILRPCSWESEEKELSEKNPYSLWSNKKNSLHKLLWKLANLSIEVVNKNQNDEGFEWARWHLSRGLASCSWWWSSGRDFSKHFGPLAWSPDEVERGVNDLLRSIRSLSNKKTRRQKIQAEKMAAQIHLLAWIKHWQKHF